MIPKKNDQPFVIPNSEAKRWQGHILAVAYDLTP